MKKLRFKRILVFLLSLMICCGSIGATCAEASTKALLTFDMSADAPSGKVGVEMNVTQQDSTRVFTWINSIHAYVNSVTVLNASIYSFGIEDNGKYISATVRYFDKTLDKYVLEDVYFYPL
ncbi:hypothetical protein [Anaerolentibacter hominis]|uniref:hypothetical protein n=1 Tax=Anaerolentibacter hominis TaxID=3079009 RepID=UPI0031B89F90